MKTLLITGGSGFLGGHLIRQSTQKYSVVTTFFKNEVKIGGCQWYHLDLKRTESIHNMLNRVHPELIIHQAGISKLDYCEEHPQEAFAVNVVATRQIIDWSKKSETRFIFLSSDMVYGGDTGNYKESGAINPLGVYAKNKAQAEEDIRKVSSNHVILRSSLIFGKPVGGGTSFTEWMEMNLRKGRTIPLYTDQYRRPILVENLVQIILEMLENDVTGTYNVGGDNILDRYTFGQKYCYYGGFDESLLVPTFMDEGPDLKAKRPKNLSMDLTKIKSVLKTKIMNIDDSLRNLFHE